ncbi:MAG: S49 family peptidase [Bacteroidota bacterium]
MDLISQLVSSPLMMLPDRVAPIVASMLRADQAGASGMEDHRVSVRYVRAQYPYDEELEETTDGDTTEESLVAIYMMESIITKQSYSGLYSKHIGLVEYMQMMSANDADPRIVAHFFQLDSPGGQASIVDTAARHIRSLQKPTVAWFNGLCASAAYYLAAACDQVYASEPTDTVGSVGVVMTIWDTREWLNKIGITEHQIYATQSEEKNADYREAIEGNYDKMRSVITDPYADAFIGAVREFRPGITSEDVFKGAVFTAAEAVTLGMIDAIQPYSQAIQSLIQLSPPAQTGNPQSNLDMTKDRIEAALGYELSSQQEGDEAGVFLRTEEVEQLNALLPEAAAIPAAAPAVTEDQILGAVQSAMQPLNDQISALTSQVTDLSDRVATQQAEIETLNGKPGRSASRVAAKEDHQPPVTKSEEPDALAKLEEMASA